MTFSYQAMDTSGKMSSGSIEAADAVEAIESLRRQGLFVSRIDAGAAPAAATARDSRGAPMGTGARLKNVAMFTRQLYVLVSSGTAVVEAMQALERQAKDAKWRRIIADVRGRVEQGSTLSEAMAAHPRVFDPVCRSLLAAGESSGEFDAMLDRVSILTRKQLHLRGAITGALVYPSLLIVVAVAVLVLMLTFVLPRFSGLFQTLDVPLPPTTKMLMTLSTILRTGWWAVLIGVVGAAAGIRHWIARGKGRELFHTFMIRSPLLGPIVRSFEVARMVRILGVLVNGRVPLLEALALARQTTGNLHYAQLVSKAETAVTRGSTISSVFAESNLVSPSLCEAIRSGEQSGQMGNLLVNMADFLDEENDVVIRSLTSIIEPVILVGLGLLVGFVAISMFLPLFDLTSMTQKK